MSSLPLPEPWIQIRSEILTVVKPTKREHDEINAFIVKLKKSLTEALSESGIDADVEVHGSVARDTWLAGQRDIDTFIILSHGSGRRDLLRVNEVVKGYLGEGWVEAYAEHPYVKKEIEGFEVEFIPCFRTEAGKGFASSTDRTPLHTGYLLPRLTDLQRDDIRVLKAFMKGIGVYGAEIKVGGFSGYLCELLVVAFGSFEGVIEETWSWGDPPVIQLNNGGIPPNFKEPLIVIDPVDPNRNVASAVSETTLWTFVAAARAFSLNPSKKYFQPESRKASSRQFESLLMRGVDFLFVVIPDNDPPVPDTLWGLLYRTEKALGRILMEAGFRVFRSGTWSDEKERHIFVYELESITLPPTVKKMGPPVRLIKESEDFLNSYLDSPNLISGPGIEGGKWWVEVKRKHEFTKSYLRKNISSGCEELGVPKRMADLLRKDGRVLINEEIMPEYNGEFSTFLNGFLRGRPDWLG
jgi:tRNA nucleotidyltransferase (CCA-adding enzyme)